MNTTKQAVASPPNADSPTGWEIRQSNSRCNQGLLATFFCADEQVLCRLVYFTE